MGVQALRERDWIGIELSDGSDKYLSIKCPNLSLLCVASATSASLR